MLQYLMNNLFNFLKPQDNFTKDEWLLKYQISSFLIISFFFSLYIFVFSIVRYFENNLFVAISQILFTLFLIYGFLKLKKDKSFYETYSVMSFIFFIAYIIIIFFNVPSNSLNILWIQSATVMVFFFLNKKYGIFMFLIISLFILYLIISGYSYNIAEYITLVGSFFTITYMMYVYENLKENEKNRLLTYTKTLEDEIAQRTQEIKQLNISLEYKLQEELEKNIIQEQILIKQSRLSSMGEMIDTIAHQWKQPLMEINSILMNIEINLPKDQKQKNKINNKIDDISFITSHMAQTIEDFRDLLSKTKIKKKFYLLHSIEVAKKY